MSPQAFMSFCAPAQAVAFASRSSLAALPAMVESAERAGICRRSSRGFVLPLAASVFRVGAAVAHAGRRAVSCAAVRRDAVASAARVRGGHGHPQTFAVPGMPGRQHHRDGAGPGGGVNLPIEGIGILLAVDTIPDMFRTTANVTGTMTLAAVLRKHSY